MTFKRTKNRKQKSKVKLTPLPVNMALAVQNNYTNQQIIMLIMLAEYYIHYLEYCKIRSDSVKNKLKTQATTTASIHQNASFSDTKPDLHSQHDDALAEYHYGVSLTYYKDSLEKIENESFYITASEQNFGSNFQVPIQVGSFCFVPI